jgi:hypothetical protein
MSGPRELRAYAARHAGSPGPARVPHRFGRNPTVSGGRARAAGACGPTPALRGTAGRRTRPGPGAVSGRKEERDIGEVTRTSTRLGVRLHLCGRPRAGSLSTATAASDRESGGGSNPRRGSLRPEFSQAGVFEQAPGIGACSAVQLSTNLVWVYPMMGSFTSCCSQDSRGAASRLRQVLYPTHTVT